MNAKVNGIILNPFAQAGNSQKSFDVFKTSDDFYNLSMHEAKIFNCSHFQNLSQLKNELILWLKDLSRNQTANIVSIGGDGLFHHILNAVMNLPEENRKSITLGAIGTGSSNDLHKPYKSEGRAEYKKIPYRLDFEHRKLFDIGQVEFTSPIAFKEYFAINASLGATALGNWFFNHPDKTLAKLKKMSTGTAITYATFWALKNFKPQNIKIEFSGNEMTVPVTNLGLIKNPHFTGSLVYPMSPLIDDGFLHLYIAHTLNFLEMISLTLNLSKGKFNQSEKLIHEIVEKVNLEVADKSQELIIELDGEIFQTKSATVTVKKQAVWICP